ncbi:hydroxypyruvate reductase [Aliiroseovarius halocynthiae]|uniref:D-glycerate dehydrogenase n=1 Tax=Aliiroseovarius halocynthiae TaxID=985055 RepID=A0A545SXX4_9RHOB|nr:D-glycerate dehydrogenase [Aliiroseovarius halocynthiae]TQV69813.1 D-glycerate dehydrogenase [Aliiroseovarius halocynthiae]SMR81710.1 hydroxypyruvate reductase [Aliiroseovarius halocynthiae]
MKLFITRPLPDAVLARARGAYDTTVRSITTPMTPREMTASLRDYDIVLPTLGDIYSASIFDSAGPIRARLLANFGVGYNHIDVDAAKAHGLLVTNTPGAVTDATADTAMTLILMTARRAGEGERMLRSGAWEGWHPTQLLGQHVSGKTVGIIGMGRIGEAIAMRCHFGFGMNVVFYNRSTKSPDLPAQQLTSIKDVARAADILVLALPGGPSTRHLIDKATFDAMPPHAILINIARGEIVDEAALITALEEGQITGAGLDVYEFEPEVPKALTDREDVTLLPHLGTATLEVRTDMGMLAMDNIDAFAQGKPLPTSV